MEMLAETQKRRGIKTGRPVRVVMHVLGEGRTDQRVIREAQALAAHGMNVQLIDIESAADRPRVEMVGDVQLRHISMPSWFVQVRFKPWFLVKLARIILRGAREMMRTKADLYHAQDLTALPAVYIASRLTGTPYIFDAHEIPLASPNIERWKRLTAIAARVVRHLVTRSAAVITVSPPIVDVIQERFGGPRAVVIRNVPALHLTSRTNRIREYLGLSQDVRIALYQGNLQPDRRLDLLVLAAKSLPEGIRIVMMGKGPSQEALATLIQSEGVADRVSMIPAVPYNELLSWTSSADLGLVLYEPTYALNVKLCLPNKIFEYIAAGLPVLASELVAVAELLREYDAGAITPSLEPEAIARTITDLMHDRVALDRMQANARAASTVLNWENEQERLIALYHDLLPEMVPAPEKHP
jgi:glycosyltransferase involved in cell wall biosynthesis